MRWWQQVKLLAIGLKLLARSLYAAKAFLTF
jgi:hypothetical protein